MGKNHRAQADRDIREHVSGRFLARAAVYWDAVDLERKQAAIVDGKKTARDRPVIGENNIREPGQTHLIFSKFD
jgi:hypothetical protein